LTPLLDKLLSSLLSAARPFGLADPTASHIAAIHQSCDANVCDRNQNGRAENQGKHSLGHR
jgi:hypothetical protein